MPLRESAHVVQFQKAFDAEGVCEYLSSGLAGGQSAIVIALDSHADAIRGGLSKRAPAQAASRVAFVSAEETVIGFSSAGARLEKMWRRKIGSLIEAAASSAGGQVVVYTETPGLLWRREQKAAALQVERLLTGARLRCSTSIVCGYAVDLLTSAQAAFDVVELHDLARADDEPRRLKRYETAVEQTLREQAAMLRSLVAEDHRLRDLSFGQAAMIWLCRHMPKMAEKVAAAARD